MITQNKKMYMLILISIVFAVFTSISFASDTSQQIAAVSQKIQVLQEKLSAANNKIEQLCDCTTTKNTTTQASKTNVHRTANGHGR
jgi:peptidoglycan hydrolase CwlO-like protein